MDEIAQTIANQLQAKLSSKEKALLADKRPTSDPALLMPFTNKPKTPMTLTPREHHAHSTPETSYSTRSQLPPLPYRQLAVIYANRYGDETQYSDDQRVARTRDSRGRRLRARCGCQPDRGEPHLARAYYYFMLSQRIKEARS